MLDKKYKRINPNTGKPFTKGDLREDGKVFFAYKRPIKSDGFYTEGWVTEKYLEKAKNKRRINGGYLVKFNPNKHKKRLDENGNTFIVGTRREDGKLFFSYGNTASNITGYQHEKWLSQKSFDRNMIVKLLSKIKIRTKKKNIPCNLDIDYLVSIFPDPPICPATGKKIFFGLGYETRHLSPSIDRIIPSKGYVKGNVRWVSFMANAIMNEFDAEDILKVGNWLKKQNIKRTT